MAIPGDSIPELSSKVRAICRILNERGAIARPTQKDLAIHCELSVVALRACLRSDRQRMAYELQTKIAAKVGFAVSDPTWLDREARIRRITCDPGVAKDTADNFELMLRQLR